MVTNCLGKVQNFLYQFVRINLDARPDIQQNHDFSGGNYTERIYMYDNIGLQVYNCMNSYNYLWVCRIMPFLRSLRLPAHLGVIFFKNQCSQVSVDSDINYMAPLNFLVVLRSWADSVDFEMPIIRQAPIKYCLIQDISFLIILSKNLFRIFGRREGTKREHRP